MSYINKDIAIVIASYDGAEDLWIPLLKSYRKNWPDIPFKIYLIINSKKIFLDNVTIINIENEKSWSDRILQSIDKINEEYIFFTFDDLFLHKKIDTKLILTIIENAMKDDMNYLRFHPSPKPDKSINKYYGEIIQNRPYRASLVFSIFKKDILKELLNINESAWEFEKNATFRSNKFNKFYVLNYTVIPYLNGVIRGRWMPSVLRYLLKNNFINKPIYRDTLTNTELVIQYFKRLRIYIFLNFTPNIIQRLVRYFYNKVK
jgi:hypothetical protein